MIAFLPALSLNTVNPIVTVSPELKLRGKAKKGRNPPKATTSCPSVFTMNCPPSFKGLLNTKPASFRGEMPVIPIRESGGLADIVFLKRDERGIVAYDGEGRSRDVVVLPRCVHGGI